MLTCKSLFGLGYRGERLIEPSTMVEESAQPVRAALVGTGRCHGVRSGNRRDRQIAGTRRQVVGRAFAGGNSGGHPGQSPVGILTIRRIDAIRSQVLSAGGWVKTPPRHTDAVHRLDVGRGTRYGRDPLRYSRTPPGGGCVEEARRRAESHVVREVSSPGSNAVTARVPSPGPKPLSSDQSLVAGSLRSVPQDSWNSSQFCQVKRMIRGSGSSKFSTYSQTLNRQDVGVARLDPGLQ